MRLGNKPDPGRQVASGRERLPITHLGDQGGSDDRANAGDFFEPPAFLTRSVPGVDAPLDGSDLGRDGCVLASKNIQAKPRRMKVGMMTPRLLNSLDKFTYSPALGV